MIIPNVTLIHRLEVAVEAATINGAALRWDRQAKIIDSAIRSTAAVAVEAAAAATTLVEVV